MSVVIPTYNHGQFVVAALESVFAQIYGDFEVIVIDDGSTDGTQDILKPLADQGRIRFIRKANGGQASARNAGIAMARAKYIAMLDDDDLWPADKLKWQVEWLEEHPDVVMVSGEVEYLGAEGRPFTAGISVITHEKLFERCPITSPGQTLVRAERLRAIGGLDETLWATDDWDLLFRLSRMGRIELHDRPSLYYRAHESNASRDKLRWAPNLCRVIQTQLKFAEPGRRRELRHRAYLTCWTICGWDLLGTMWDDFLQLRWKRGWKIARALWPMARVLVWDWSWLRRVGVFLVRYKTQRSAE